MEERRTQRSFDVHSLAASTEIAAQDFLKAKAEASCLEGPLSSDPLSSPFSCNIEPSISVIEYFTTMRRMRELYMI